MIYCVKGCEAIPVGDWGNLYPWANLECETCGRHFRVRGVDYADFYGEPHQHMYIDTSNDEGEVTAFHVESDPGNVGIQMKYWDDKDCRDFEALPLNPNRIFDIFRAEGQVWASVVERALKKLEDALGAAEHNRALEQSGIAVFIEAVRKAISEPISMKQSGESKG